MNGGAPPALAVEGLIVEATDGTRVLDGVSFDVGTGEIVALVGESGSGKTMAARAALRLLPAGLRQTGGRIALAGTDLGALSEDGMRQQRGRRIGLVFQEPMSSLNPSMRIGDQLTEALVLHDGIAREEALTRAQAMLGRVRIADPAAALRAYPHAFSGGMRQRIMLASAMLLRPTLLIADEPTTALDTLTQREVLDLLVELTRTAGTAVLLITHDLGLVARYAARAVVLRAGRAVETGRPRRCCAPPPTPTHKDWWPRFRVRRPADRPLAAKRTARRRCCHAATSRSAIPGLGVCSAATAGPPSSPASRSTWRRGRSWASSADRGRERRRWGARCSACCRSARDRSRGAAPRSRARRRRYVVPIGWAARSCIRIPTARSIRVSACARSSQSHCGTPVISMRRHGGGASTRRWRRSASPPSPAAIRMPCPVANASASRSRAPSCAAPRW
jgi:peptide/nickel transport system ATP-binding protein